MYVAIMNASHTQHFEFENNIKTLIFGWGL